MRTGKQSTNTVKRAGTGRIVRFIVALLPYVLFLAGLFILSLGFFSWAENESILSVFITKRDQPVFMDLNGLTDPGATPAPLQEETAITEPDKTLVTPFYYYGEQIGTISIASLDMSVEAYQGDLETELRMGAGHSSVSLLPGQDGNIVFAAHRTSFFKPLENVAVGDEVVFETTYGTFTYAVREIRILEAADFSLITKETDKEQLTLYTCYPFKYIGNAPDRYAVFCDLVESELNT